MWRVQTFLPHVDRERRGDSDMMQPPPTRQQQIESHLRYTFMVLQHRIEERNWAEAIQNSAVLSKILMDIQKLTIESSQPQPEVQNDQDKESSKTG
jgi:hypothetical protein